MTISEIDPPATLPQSGAYSRMTAAFAEIQPLFAPGTLDRLRSCFAEPGRAYHNQVHILMMLHLFERLRDLSDDPLAVKIAIFFHDAIYHISDNPARPPAHDNEERSVDLMKDCLVGPVSPSIIKAVRLIRSTAGHATDRDMDTRLLHDLDLSILASGRQRYQQYESQIRREYAVYPDALYIPARLAILRGFLERRRIFTLPGLGLMWEDTARSNLNWAVAVLACGVLPGQRSHGEAS